MLLVERVLRIDETIVDSAFISNVENKWENVQFKRVDAEIAENLIDPVDAAESILNKDEETKLKELFDKYGDPENFTFDKTHIVVELARDQETEYISRSQAKRILVGLEKFRHVVLDFRNVRTVGQAFVDEVFRVFGQEHPEVKFEHINANENVEFMILRGNPPVKA